MEEKQQGQKKDGKNAKEPQGLASKKDKMEAQQQKPEGGQKEQKNGKVENDRTDPAPPPEGRVATLGERVRELGRWGILPPKLAEEMLSTSGKEAPAEYREIISRYYKRMNEFYERSRGR